MKQKPSRPLITYKVKAYNITHHLETVDAALEVMTRELKSATDPDASIASSLGLSIKRFQSLRMPVKQSVSLINRVRINNAEYGLIALYSAFGEYSKNLLKEFYKTNPLLVVGKASGTLQYHEIVKLGDYTMIADYMVEQVFKKLEGVRNTSKQLTSTIDGTGVILSETLLHKALMYFEIRHLLVLRNLSYLIHVLSCHTLSAWHEQHNPSHCPSTTCAL